MPALLFAPEPAAKAPPQAPEPPRPTKPAAAARKNLVEQGDSWLPDFEALPADAAPSLEGTQWLGTEDFGSNRINNRFFELLPEGKVRFGARPEDKNTQGSWRQRGASLYLETSNVYAEWRLELREGALEGRAHNCTGQTWTVRLARR